MPRIAWLLLINMVVLFFLMVVLGLRINISESYPLGIYRRASGDYQRESLVETCLPEGVAALMVERSYIPGSGNCRGYPPLIKRVYGLAGDTVEVTDQVRINGVPIANTGVGTSDGTGRTLTPATSTRIPPHEVWLMSTRHPESYDSRYFGAIPDALIRSRLEPLWTLE